MILILAILTTAATVSARVFDSIPTTPQGWTKESPALSTDKLTLKIGLKQEHAVALEQAVLAVSTPGNPDYGKHLTREQLRAYVAPRQQSVDDVTAWLAEHGIAPAVDNDWMTFVTDVKTANGMLGADFHWYRHSAGGAAKLRTLRYSVPDDMAEHVDLVQPTTRFGHLGAKKSTIFDVTIPDDEAIPLGQVHVNTAYVDNAAPCTTSVTPQCLKAQYNISYVPDKSDNLGFRGFQESDGPDNDGHQGPHVPHGAHRPLIHHDPRENLVAFASYLEQYARYDDLAQFQSQLDEDAQGQNFSVTLISGGLDDQANSGSSSRFSCDLCLV